MAEPKDDGRAEPKDDGRADPKDDERGLSRTNGANSGAFGGGSGFVVVAFISPVGLNVPDLAVRMLQGGGSNGAPTRKALAIGRAAALAQEEARKQARKQEKLRQAADRVPADYSLSNGRRHT